MVPISSSRIVTAQRPGTEAMISEIHRQSTVGMPATARATMPPSEDEDPLPERWAYALPAGPSSAPAEARADPHTVDRRCREARMSSLKVNVHNLTYNLATPGMPRRYSIISFRLEGDLRT